MVTQSESTRELIFRPWKISPFFHQSHFAPDKVLKYTCKIERPFALCIFIVCSISKSGRKPNHCLTSQFCISIMSRKTFAPLYSSCVRILFPINVTIFPGPVQRCQNCEIGDHPRIEGFWMGLREPPSGGRSLSFSIHYKPLSPRPNSGLGIYANRSLPKYFVDIACTPSRGCEGVLLPNLSILQCRDLRGWGGLHNWDKKCEGGSSLKLAKMLKMRSQCLNGPLQFEVICGCGIVWRIDAQKEIAAMVAQGLELQIIEDARPVDWLGVWISGWNSVHFCIECSRKNL